MKKTMPGKNLMTVLDLGQSKFIAVVAEMVSDSNYQVIGYGDSAAEGMQKGKVVNIDEVAGAVTRTIKKAEVMSGHALESLTCVGISGSYVRGHTHHAATYIAGDTVTREDVQQVMQTAQAHQLIGGGRIIHVLEQSFSINRQNGIRQPLGMEGDLLEGSAHVISVDSNVLANIERCLMHTRLPVRRTISNHLASTGAVLTPAEKDLGAILVDFGAGVCDITVFDSGKLVHIDTVPGGGEEIDEDIARMYRISKDEAERRKREHGSATETGGAAAGGQPPGQLALVIQARAREILGAVHERIRQFAPEQIGAGMVLTGGGSLLAGIDELAKEITGMPVRIGRPTYAGKEADVLSQPQYAAALGLLEMCKMQREEPVPAGGTTAARLASKLRSMFSVN